MDMGPRKQEALSQIKMSFANAPDYSTLYVDWTCHNDALCYGVVAILTGSNCTCYSISTDGRRPEVLGNGNRNIGHFFCIEETLCMHI